jgi:hypothetical protein
LPTFRFSGVADAQLKLDILVVRGCLRLRQGAVVVVVAVAVAGFPAWPRAAASRCWKSPRLDVVQLGHGPDLTTEANVVPL